MKLTAATPPNIISIKDFLKKHGKTRVWFREFSKPGFMLFETPYNVYEEGVLELPKIKLQAHINACASFESHHGKKLNEFLWSQSHIQPYAEVLRYKIDALRFVTSEVTERPSTQLNHWGETDFLECLRGAPIQS